MLSAVKNCRPMKEQVNFERKMADGRRCCVSVCSWFQAANDMPVDPSFRQKHAPLSTILQTTSMVLATKNLIHTFYCWACTNGVGWINSGLALPRKCERRHFRIKSTDLLVLELGCAASGRAENAPKPQRFVRCC